MANSEKIEDIIDDKAFQQLERLLRDLGIAQNEFLKTANAVDEMNKNLAKTTGLKDLTDQMAKIEQAGKKMQEASDKAVVTAEKAVKAENDLVVATKARLLGVQEESKLLDGLSCSLEQNIRLQVRLKAELAQVRAEQKAQNDQLKTSDRVSASMSKRTAELATREIELKAALQQSNLDIRRAIKETNAAESSYDQLSAKLDRLRGAYKALSTEERNNMEIGGSLLASIQEYDKELKALDATMGVHNRNVGNYTSATDNLSKATGNLFPQLNQIQQTIEDSKNAYQAGLQVIKDYVSGKYAQEAAEKAATVAKQQAVIAEQQLAAGTITATQAEKARAAVTHASTVATNASSKSLQILKIALISTGIGAIVVVLGTLITYLTSTQEGIDRVTAVTRPLQAVFQSLLGLFQNVGKALFDAFSDPKQLIKDLGQLVLDQLINRFNSFAVIVQGIIDMDFKKTADGFIQLGTGVENMTDKIQNAAKSTGEFFSEAAKRGAEIDRLQKDIEKGEINFIRRQAELAKIYKEQSEIAENIAAPEEERRKAAKLAMDATDESLRLEKELIDMRKQKLTLEQQNNDTLREGTGSQKEMAELDAEILAAETRASEARTTARSKLNAVNNQIAANAKKQHEERMKELEEQEKAEEKLRLSALSLEESRLSRSSSRSKAVVDDSELGFEDRMSNLEQYLAREEELINLNREKELMNKELSSHDITRIEEETQAAIEALKLEGAALSDKILKDQLSKEDKERADAQARVLAGIEKARDEQLLALNDRYASGGMTEKDYADERLKIQQDFARKYVEAEMQAVQDIIDINKAKGLDVSAQEKQLAALKLRLSQETTDKQISDLQKVAEEEKRLKELKQQLGEEMFELGSTLINGRFEREKNNLQEQNDLIDINKEKEIERVNQSIVSEQEKANKVAMIEARANAQQEANARRMREIQEKQARFEKAASVARIIQATHQAIMVQLAGAPFFPISGPLIPIIAAIGAAQIAQVIATPIPKYAKGTDYSPEGLAWVGEKGTELMIDRSGNMALTPDRPTLTWLQKGTQIIPNHELKQTMFNQSVSSVTEYQAQPQIDINRLVDSYEKGTAELKKALKSQGRHTTIIGKSGIHYMYRKGASWKEYLNRNGLTGN